MENRLSTNQHRMQQLTTAVIRLAFVACVVAIIAGVVV